MSESHAMSDAVRNRVVDAAAAELVDRGIDDFSVDGVAARSGVDPAAIHAQWHDRRVLLMDAMLSTADQLCTIRDTGCLREDLRALAASLIALADTAHGRRRFHRLIASGRDADLMQIGADFWEVRFNAAAPILQRAADRGELRDDVDHHDATRMFAAALYYDVIYHDAPVRPDYAEHVVDIFIRGITR